jgi:hypothetical protein
MRLEIGCLDAVDIPRYVSLVFLNNHLPRRVMNFSLFRRAFTLLVPHKFAIGQTHRLHGFVVTHEFLPHIKRSEELAFRVDGGLFDQRYVVDVNGRHGELVITGTAVQLVGR